MLMEYYCYLIYSESKNRSYIGITNNLKKRLDKHNNKIHGGAKYTKIATDWKYKRVKNIIDKKTALSYEWYAKRYKNKNEKWTRINGINKKIHRFDSFADFEDIGFDKNSIKALQEKEFNIYNN